jgi:hypothetical protein
MLKSSGLALGPSFNPIISYLPLPDCENWDFLSRPFLLRSYGVLSRMLADLMWLISMNSVWALVFANFLLFLVEASLNVIS